MTTYRIEHWQPTGNHGSDIFLSAALDGKYFNSQEAAAAYLLEKTGKIADGWEYIIVANKEA